MTDTLTLTPAQVAALREALGHLESAEGQALPSDDQIIVGHLRDAIDLIRPVIWPNS